MYIHYSSPAFLLILCRLSTIMLSSIFSWVGTGKDLSLSRLLVLPCAQCTLFCYCYYSFSSKKCTSSPVYTSFHVTSICTSLSVTPILSMCTPNKYLSNYIYIYISVGTSLITHTNTCNAHPPILFNIVTHIYYLSSLRLYSHIGHCMSIIHWNSIVLIIALVRQCLYVIYIWEWGVGSGERVLYILASPLELL